MTVDNLTFAEVGFFALDVYYNQTYGSRIGTSAAGSRHDNNNHGIGSGSGSGQGNSFGGSGGGRDGDQGLPLLYKPYPKYRDPFLDTYSNYRFISNYRSIDGASVGRRNITAERILQWISLAHET